GQSALAEVGYGALLLEPKPQLIFGIEQGLFRGLALADIASVDDRQPVALAIPDASGADVAGNPAPVVAANTALERRGAAGEHLPQRGGGGLAVAGMNQIPAVYPDHLGRIAAECCLGRTAREQHCSVGADDINGVGR